MQHESPPRFYQSLHHYNLTKVPTTIFYTEGVKLRSIEGAFTADSLAQYLQALLSQEEAEDPES